MLSIRSLFGRRRWTERHTAARCTTLIIDNALPHTVIKSIIIHRYTVAPTTTRRRSSRPIASFETCCNIYVIKPSMQILIRRRCDALPAFLAFRTNVLCMCRPTTFFFFFVETMVLVTLMAYKSTTISPGPTVIVIRTLIGHHHTWQWNCLTQMSTHCSDNWNCTWTRFAKKASAYRRRFVCGRSTVSARWRPCDSR